MARDADNTENAGSSLFDEKRDEPGVETRGPGVNARGVCLR